MAKVGGTPPGRPGQPVPRRGLLAGRRALTRRSVCTWRWSGRAARPALRPTAPTATSASPSEKERQQATALRPTQPSEEGRQQATPRAAHRWRSARRPGGRSRSLAAASSSGSGPAPTHNHKRTAKSADSGQDGHRGAAAVRVGQAWSQVRMRAGCAPRRRSPGPAPTSDPCTTTPARQVRPSASSTISQGFRQPPAPAPAPA